MLSTGNLIIHKLGQPDKVVWSFETSYGIKSVPGANFRLKDDGSFCFFKGNVVCMSDYTNYSNETTQATTAMTAVVVSNETIIGAPVESSIISALIFTCLLFLYIKYKMKQERNIERGNSTNNDSINDTIAMDDLHLNREPTNIGLCPDLLNNLRLLEVRLDSLKIEHNTILGEGEYSIVHKGLAYNLPTVSQGPTIVAVKTIIGHKELDKRAMLEEEARIILKSGRHINTVNVLGIVMEDHPLLILEYCTFGSLLSYLRLRRKGRVYIHVDKNGKLMPFDERTVEYQWLDFCLNERTEGRHIDRGGNIKDNMLSTNDLINFCHQICTGMEYLSARSIIHRDLAARNILVSDNQILKISNFGLAKQGTLMYTAVNAKIVLPIRWLSPEAIIDRIFSTKSDVWSYGIVLWEIFSLGQSPFNQPDVVNESAIVFAEWLIEGHRMERPEGTPSSIYDIMKHCWDLEVENRPNFANILFLLDVIVSNAEDDQIKYLLLEDGK